MSKEFAEDGYGLNMVLGQLEESRPHSDQFSTLHHIVGYPADRVNKVWSILVPDSRQFPFGEVHVLLDPGVDVGTHPCLAAEGSHSLHYDVRPESSGV